ncbi:MAG: rRNA maturation RNase YbeY [Burkholderiaceae bacterium]|jgi:probable rRNA maturation factor|nr:rRNA maturation RNase YbeY [Burkholderiaceae bacterium]
MPALTLSLQFARFDGVAAHRAALPRRHVARWLRAALGEDVESAELTVRIVGIDEGRSLNRAFRGKDYATDVLTFGYDSAPNLLADLALCAPVVEREAAALGKPLAGHYAHLLVHGALHAQGWDHETGPAQARQMRAQERRILQELGLGDSWKVSR